MRLGVTTYLWSAEFTPATFDVLPRLRAAGFDGVEIPAFRPETFPAPAIRRALEASRLECTIALALVPGLSLIDDDPAVRRKTLTHVEAIIRVAAEVGASVIAGPVYCPVGYLPGRRRTTGEWQRAVDAYQALGPVLDAHGVTLALEPLNRFETYFLNTVADGVRLSDAVGHPRVGLLVDTFHANIEEKDVAAAYRAAGAHVRHVHTSENDRGTPGSGHVPWAGVFDALREIRYDGWLTIESFGFSLGDLSAAASIWRDIESSPDAIAMDGLRFLKQYRHGG
jgi:D-psicose/D-tagatose/L-ribulose 3-epimerase